MNAISCLRCKNSIDAAVEACPHCGERVTLFQRTYANKLIDGKYQILERLGVGGMGEIFKVRHIHLNEQRVIKIMRANIASDDQALQRFLHEARTSTMIKHRNLAMLYDFSTLEDGSYYMVWEFIDGTNIQKWIAANGPIPPRLTVEISIQALHGLEHLHTMGLIHRDISPENVMLSQDYQGKLLVKVIDFGIAKQLSDGEGGQGLTQTGMFLGKLKYASPEQAGFIKEGEHLDARSDLYSFGVVMYEMLAGRAPFQATNPHGYILKHATEKPLPISQNNPAVKVPAKLEAEVMRSLEKDRDTRHHSAGDWAVALEAIREQIPPDEKYGLGDWKGTISQQRTVTERKGPQGGTAPMPTSTGGAATVIDSGQATQITRGGGNEATVIERTATGTDASPTVMTRSGSTDATVVERMLGPDAQPTVLEPKVASWGTAAPTIIERTVPGIRPEKKKPTAMIAAIAAIVVIAIAAGAWFALKPKPPAPAIATTATTAPVAATDSTSVVAPPLVAGQSELHLLASPYGELQKVIDMQTNKEIQFASDDMSTPLRIPLRAGDYKLYVSGPNGETQTREVHLDAGSRPRELITFRSPNLDALSEDVLRP